MESIILGERSEAYIQRLRRFIWGFLKWFLRIEITGLENVPEGACLLIADHNSGALLESHSLLFALSERKRTVFGLNHPALFRIPFVSTHFKKIGAVAATREASYEVLKNHHGLLIFPGGNRQAFRPWTQRHSHSFPWARGWSEIAVAANVPVIPIKFIGSHNSNPILFSSQILSKMLILPWLLGVKWFPFSLAQVLFALFSLVVTGGLDLPLLVVLATTYLAFCFTPLIPVIPARIQMKIYPPLSPQGKSAVDLQTEMAALMDARDYPQGKRQIYPLNGLERFMYYHESAEVHYNSHFTFSFTGFLDREKILQTTNTWIDALPQVRSAVFKGLWRSQRYSYASAWFRAKDIVHFHEGLEDEAVDRFCNQVFNLNINPGVRFLVMTDGVHHRVVFSCHHSLFDGAAHAYAFEEWSRIYNGLEIHPKWKQLETFRYRRVISTLGIWNSLKLFKQNFAFRPPRMQMSVASLVQPQVLSSERFVCAKTFHLSGGVSLRDDFYELALKVVERTLQDQGDFQNPLIAYLPTGLRWALKVKASLQNILVSHTLFLSRKSFGDGSLKERIVKKIKSDPLTANAKFLFGVLPLCSLGSESKLRRQFSSLDSPSAPLTSSLLLVSAAIPKGYVTPVDWQNLYIAARGTLVRSPGVGLIFTGKKGCETITLEYLRGLISPDTLESLETNLLMALEEYSQSRGSERVLKSLGLAEEIT